MLTDAGSLASIAGLLVALLGFAFALWQILALKSATERERLQRERLQARLTSFAVVADASGIPPSISEIASLLKSGQADFVRMRLGDLRLRLVSLRDALVLLDPKDDAGETFQRHLLEVAHLTRTLDAAAANGRELNATKIQAQLDGISESAHSVVVMRRMHLGGPDADH